MTANPFETGVSREMAVREKAADLQTLKVRDDLEPVRLEKTEPGKFKISGDERPHWTEDGKIDMQGLRMRIEPWLTSLFQSEHLSLLAGAGLTHAVHFMATGMPATGMSGSIVKGIHKDVVEKGAGASAKAAGRGTGNIEDQFRIANELLQGLRILGKADEAKELVRELSGAMASFAKSILESEGNIATAPEPKMEAAFTTLITFLMSFASRTGTRDRLNIFTTNYDRLLEAGAELAGIHLLDRFVGNLMPIFRSSRLDLDMHYNPPGIRGEPRYLEGVARFTKLHGSVDWVHAKGDIRRIGLPFGADDVDPFLKAPGLDGANAHQLMIHPNAAKDWETADHPYVELFRDLAASICRPNSTLVTYGYGFGDEHINRVIRDMLTIPSTHLVVISRDDPYGRILKLAGERRPQVSLLLGTDLADFKTLTENFLPKAAIDRTTSRMSELLMHRMGTMTIRKKVDGKGDGDDA